MPISDSFILSSTLVQHKTQPGTFVDQIFADFDTFSNRTAIVDHASDRRITFADLKRITSQVASGLAKRGFGKGDFLSLFTSNCIENAPIAFGAAVTGATLHLVKPIASQEELRFHFNLVSPKIIVTSASSADAVLEAVRASAPHVQDIYVIGAAVDGCRRVEELLEDPGDANPWGKVDIDPREDVALMMLTGGTTGMSKTVMIPHETWKQGVLNTLLVEKGSNDGELSLGYVPFSHSFSMFQLYGVWLMTGCGVVAISSNDPETLIRAIEKHKITRMISTPAMLAAFEACPYFAKADLGCLNRICCGGAALSKAAENRIRCSLRKPAPNVVFQQGYGLTESGGVIEGPLPTDPKYKEKLGSTGIVKPNVQLRVVSIDGHQRPCGTGELGRFYLRASSLMKGYFKNEEATRKAIVDGWYDTEDYGYFDEDGYVFVVDRVGDLIQQENGLIVPSHVEDVLRSHPAISDCAVVGRPSDDDGKHVVMAFVVRKEGSDLTENDVRRFGEEKLEEHEQLVGGVRFVSSIPKSPAGKMLRRALMKDM